MRVSSFWTHSFFYQLIINRKIFHSFFSNQETYCTFTVLAPAMPLNNTQTLRVVWLITLNS